MLTPEPNPVERGFGFFYCKLIGKEEDCHVR